MATAAVTSKGQITIPHQIRAYLGIHSGDKIKFNVENDGRVYLTLSNIDVRELKGCLPRPKINASIDDMNRAIVKRGAKI